MKLTKAKLKEMIREEIQKLNEGGVKTIDKDYNFVTGKTPKGQVFYELKQGASNWILQENPKGQWFVAELKKDSVITMNVFKSFDKAKSEFIKYTNYFGKWS